MDNEPEIECPECYGTGKLEAYDTWQHKPGDDIWLVDYPCDNCDGTGLVYNPDYNEEPIIRPMTDEERKRAKERSGQNDRNVLR
jgi:hypothetical protein